MMAALETARDALALITGVASCKIGLEANLSPADYPMIRLVPARIIPGRPYHGRECETLVYFGAPIANSEGMEEVYQALFALEAEILTVLRSLEARYRETITDEDRLDAYKIMAIRVDLIGVNVAPPAPAPAPP
jgi:hypothetical protein